MNQIQKKFVLDAMDDPEPLTDWETGFIDSLAKKGDDYELSDKQNEILNRISQKYV